MAYKAKNYRKFIATAATATLVAGAVAPLASAATADQFKDVAPKYKEAVQFLLDKNATNGMSDTQFGINENIKRVDAAVWVARVLELDIDNAPDAGFKDVPARAQKEVNALKAAGITNGKSATEFGSNDLMTRGQLAKWIVAGFGLTGKTDKEFSDVKGTSYEEAVSILVANGITQGINETQFGTNNNTKRGDFAIFLQRADAAKTPAAAVTTVKAENGKVTVTLDKEVEAVKAEDFKLTQAIDGKEATTVTATAAKLSEDKKSVEITIPVIVESEKEQSVVVSAAYKNGASKAAEAFKVASATPKVETVTANNGGEIVVKFNQAVKKESVIDSTDSLVDGLITLNGADQTALKAELSKDGKTLSIFAPTAKAFDGAYSFVLAANKVESINGVKLAKFEQLLSVTDTTRASVVSVTAQSKYVFDIELSEPVKATGTVSALLADGTTATVSKSELKNNGKVVRVTLASGTAANKEVSVLLPSLTDIKGNVSVPTTVKVTVSDADKVAPTVVSATAIAPNQVAIKFSEEVTVKAASKFKVDGVVVTKAEVDAKDKTIVNITLPTTVTTTAVVQVEDKAVADLSDNENTAWAQIVNFSVDKVAPEVASSKVINKNGVNYLELTFSERVTKNATAGNLTFKTVNEFGITVPTTVPAANVEVDSKDATIVTVKLAKSATENLKENVSYTVDFAKGYFKDLFNNESVAETIKFDNTTITTETKLGLKTVTSGVSLDGAYLDVTFTAGVDVASATNIGNYTVEGSEVVKAELTANSADAATVRVYLKDDSVETQGNYEVTVGGVKGFYSTVTEMETKTQNIVINENVRAFVKNSSVTLGSASTVLTVTFSEALTDVAAKTLTNDFDLVIEGEKVTTAKVTGDQNERNAAGKTVINFTINKDIRTDLANKKEVKLVPQTTIDLVDLAGNKVKASDIVIK